MADRFLSRWARLKSEGGQRGPATPGKEPSVEAPRSPQGEQRVASLDPAARADTPADARDTRPVHDPNLDLPSLESLTPDSDFTPFLRSGVAAATRTAALKTLFTDPHYNIMDGLDIYIGDYTQSDPIPDEVLRKLTQSRTLGLFDEPEKSGKELLAGEAANAPASQASPAADTAVPEHDAAGRDAGQETAPPLAAQADPPVRSLEGPSVQGAEDAADPGVANAPASDGVDKSKRSA